MSNIDLDKFPTSPTAKRMLHNVSPIYGSSYFGKWLFQVMGQELDDVWRLVRELKLQNFTTQVTWGIEYQEHKYSIEPDKTLSLEERRARLHRKRVEHFPLNPARVEKYLLETWNVGTDIDETYKPGVLKLTIQHDDDQQLRPMLKDLRRIKPSHLSLGIFYEVIIGAGDDAEAETLHVTDELSGLSVVANFEEGIPHGQNAETWLHDGTITRSSAYYHDGAHTRGGDVIRGETEPPTYARGGVDDALWDEIRLGIVKNLEDTPGIIQAERDGTMARNGTFARGDNPAPVDMAVCFNEDLRITETVEPPEDSALIQAETPLEDRPGAIQPYRGMEMERGGDWQRGENIAPVDIDGTLLRYLHEFSDNPTDITPEHDSTSCRDGTMARGTNSGPIDLSLNFGYGPVPIEEIEPPAEAGTLTISRILRRNGAATRDGTRVRGYVQEFSEI